MSVIACLTTEHNPALVFLATVICLAGAVVTMSLFGFAVRYDTLQRFGWLFLTAVCAGSSIWATHFIAMLGHLPDVPVTFDPSLTLLSILVAVAGTGAAFTLAARPGRKAAVISGGMLLGLSISAMHFVGMFGYVVDGIVSWDPAYVAASIALAVTFSTLSIYVARSSRTRKATAVSVVFLVMAITSLHFTAMTAFNVEPVPGSAGRHEAQTFIAMATGILLVCLLVLGTGISSYLIERRTRAVSKERIDHMTFHDPLTNLGNRRAFLRVADEAYGNSRVLACLLVDLDQFKQVNETYGYEAGDAALIAVADRIGKVVGERDFVARVGGDEIAVMLHDEPQRAFEMAERIVRQLAEPVQWKQRPLTIPCRIGISSTDLARSVETLMQHAEIALAEAKQSLHAKVFRYEPGMQELIAARSKAEAELAAAVAKGELRLVYQPILNVATGRIAGYEALVRWAHPRRGHISPAEFIPLAEETGAIVEIGRWVLDEACRAAMTWPGDTFVAVNVSARQFTSPLLPSHVLQALTASGLPARRLEIELTETALASSGSQVADVLRQFQILGIAVALDDFGTGYSSLTHLRDLPLDRIKIDRSFVMSAETDRNSLAVLKAIVRMGEEMGIATTAEGVETASQFELLTALGCAYVQGYLVGRPGPVDIHLDAATRFAP